MIQHIVLFSLKDKSSESVEKAASVLRSMEGNVPQICSITVGTDFLHSSRSYDLGLLVTLKNREALESYQTDEYHCTVVKTYMHAARDKSVSLDFEVEV